VVVVVGGGGEDIEPGNSARPAHTPHALTDVFFEAVSVQLFASPARGCDASLAQKSNYPAAAC